MPADAQTESMPRPTSSGLKVLAVGLLGLILMLVLYIGSVGPAYRFALNDPGPVNAKLWGMLDRFYAPIWWAANRWPWAGRYLRWSIGRDDIETAAKVRGNARLGYYPFMVRRSASDKLENSAAGRRCVYRVVV